MQVTVETKDKPSRRILGVPSCDFRGGNSKICSRYAASDQLKSVTLNHWWLCSEVDGGDAIAGHVQNVEFSVRQSERRWPVEPLWGPWHEALDSVTIQIKHQH